MASTKCINIILFLKHSVLNLYLLPYKQVQFFRRCYSDTVILLLEWSLLN